MHDYTYGDKGFFSFFSAGSEAINKVVIEADQHDVS